jgi:integrase
MAPRIIIKQGTRILLPSEYARLRAELDPNIGYQLICDALLNTGLRIVEFWALCDNPHWYHSSSRVIDLPKEGSAKKAKCDVTDRTIHLTAAGCKALDTLFAVRPSFRERDAMRGALRRAAVKAGLGVNGITPKMFRKMLASYLVDCRKDLGIDTLEICANMGHDEKTLRKHYYGTFVQPDHPEILEFVRGWNG